MKKAISFLVALFVSFSAVAEGGGADVTGGGGGVVDKNVVYLLDLAEAGLQKNPYFIHDSNSAEFDLDQYLRAPFTLELLSLLSAKIKDIEVIDATLASAVLGGLRVLKWSLIDLDLSETSDLHSDILSQTPVQLAIRQGSSVRIQKDLWNRMDVKNQAALIIHEIIAALANEDTHPTQVRRLVANLFHHPFYLMSHSAIQQELTNFPSNKIVQKIATRLGLVLSPDYAREGGVFYFSPSLTLYEVGRENSPARVMLLSNGLLQSTRYDLCGNKAQYKNLQRFVASYFAIEVKLPLPKDGVIHPRLTWNLVPKLFLSSTLGPSTWFQSPKCTPQNHKHLQQIKTWTQDLRPIFRN